MDRNFYTMQIVIIIVESLSARRAWIEIYILYCYVTFFTVALRKESVDRNVKWQQGEVSYGVALRKESVDRNVLCPKL